MQIAVHPEEIARAVVGPDISRGAVGLEVINHGGGALAEPEERPWIAWSELLHHLRLVFVELLQAVGESNVDRVDAESAAEHQFLPGVPRETDARLEVTQAALVQSPGGMNDPAWLSGDGVGGGRIEIADLAVCRMERALGRPPQPEVQGQASRNLPVV